MVQRTRKRGNGIYVISVEDETKRQMVMSRRRNAFERWFRLYCQLYMVQRKRKRVYEVNA
jgi:hypothetical protein